MCYALAKEALNIARYGNPWGPNVPQRKVRMWRRRVAVKRKPNLRLISSDKDSQS